LTEHYDALETRDPLVREREQFAQLARQIAYAKASAPAFARALANVGPESITTREALAQLPVIQKSQLGAL
jgi:phenylacetate-CoA ligase